MYVPPILEEQLGKIQQLVRELDSQCAEMRHETELSGRAAEFFTYEQFRLMERVTRKALLLAVLMIARSKQGHMASTASAMHMMVAMYFSRALDFLRFAARETGEVSTQFESLKPHAVPGWNGLLYLEGMLDRPQIQAFRTFEGPNAYPTHVDPGIQIPTGSLGMGPTAAIGLAFLDQYNFDHGGPQRRGLQISIIGDSEFDEGVIAESIKERASRGITGWLEFVDYNRQSLDGNLDERLVDRIKGIYEAHGIPVIILKYGSRLQRLFREHHGGIELRRRLDALSTDDYQALLRQDGGVIRRIITLRRADFEVFMRDGIRRIGDFLAELDARGQTADPDLPGLLGDKTDRDVKDLLSNLGGHDLPMLIACIENIKREGGAAAVIAYTAKGWGIDPLLGSLSGHWQKLTGQELRDYILTLGPDIAELGAEWERFVPSDPATHLLGRISAARVQYEEELAQICRQGRERFRRALVKGDGTSAMPDQLEHGPGFDPAQPVSTQAYLGGLFSRFAHTAGTEPLAPLVERLVTMSADVAFTAGLKDWVNRRGVWGPPGTVDIVQKYGEHPEMNVQPRRDGQHIRLSNLEQFLALLAAAFGKSGDLSGERRLPFAFFYDVFLERFAEMFKYAAYWDATVWFVGTIAGSSAAGESGLHHGYASGLIGRITPNAVTWEPAFPLELNWILADELRRAVEGRDQGRRVRYFRTTATPVGQDEMLARLRAQDRFAGMTDQAIYARIRQDVLAGGYRLIDRAREGGDYLPGENVVNLFATGVSVQQACRASDDLLQRGIKANVLVVTSPDLLIDEAANPQLAALVPAAERQALVPVLTVTDSHPAFLGGIAAGLAQGRCAPLSAALGITAFDRSGTEAEIRAFHGIDSGTIAAAAAQLIGGH